MNTDPIQHVPIRPALLLVADWAEGIGSPTSEAERRWCREIARLAGEMARFREVRARHAAKYPVVEKP